MRGSIVQYMYSQISATAGNVVEVTLDRQANVRLMDSYNYRRFQNGQTHQFYGGTAQVSPVRIAVPSSGTWYVVIDLGSAGGSIRHSVRVIA